MYLEVISTLEAAAKDEDVGVMALTGAGEYFSSGNDLTMFAAAKSPGDLKDLADKGRELLKMFVGSFIDFPKPIIAAVNGK